MGPPDAKTLEQTLTDVLRGLQTLGVVPLAADKTRPPGQRVAVCSTLGTGPYNKENPDEPLRYDRVNYQWPGGATATRFPTIASLEYAVHALQHPAPPEGCVVVTEKVKKRPMYEELRADWADCARNELQTGEADDQGTRKDINSAFNAVWQWLKAGDRVVLDFTHALRSISLGMIAAAILARATRENLEISMVCYGVEPSYAAKSAAAEKGCLPDSPLLDITPMMDLLEWAEAADAFLHGADASLLIQCLRKTKQPALLRLADGFDTFTRAVVTFRYTAALEAARAVAQMLHALLPPDTTPDMWSEAAQQVPAFRVVGEVLKQAVSELQAGEHTPETGAGYEGRIAAMERVAQWLTARDAGDASLGVRSELLALRLARPLGLFPPGPALDKESDLAVVAFVANTLSKVIAKRKKNPAVAIHPYNWVFAIASDSLRTHLENLDAEQAINRLQAAIATDPDVQRDFKRSEKIASVRNHLLHAGWDKDHDPKTKASTHEKTIQTVVAEGWGL
jgi:hypothetical protein